jgi:hypothetical protein
MVPPNYRCPQQHLYLVSEVLANSLQIYLSQFHEASPQFTPAFVDNYKAAIAAAASLPDHQSRNATPEVLRVQLTTAAKQATDHWQSLKSYIKDAYPRTHKPLIEAAGSTIYRKACNNNWVAVHTLTNTAYNFMLVHQQQLMQNDNMPASFPPQFLAIKSAIEDLHTSFITATQQNLVTQQQKIQANNAIYKTAGKIMRTGQIIFRSDPARKSQFIFSQLKQHTH